MKLATLNDGTPDGRLLVVSRGLERTAIADGIARTLQDALDRWDETRPALERLSEQLSADAVDLSRVYDPAMLMAPLPRAWQWLDASAFKSHAELTTRAFDLPNTWHDRPLMYQGMSHRFLSATEDVPFPSEADGIDFEGEFGVITGPVAAGASPSEGLRSIRLVVQINDWSLRAIGRDEMARGFGWVRAKPACSMAPVAVTPDELGEAWRDARVRLPLIIHRGEERFGAADGGEMAFGFDELVAHAAYSRDLPAGTVVGSGTVSNAAWREVGSSCIVERRGIEILDGGAPTTPFLSFGERVRMQATDTDGGSLFGAIDQGVVRQA